MKNLIFIFSILIILFKTETVLSDNNIFNVNNIEISKETSKNKEKLISDAFRKAYDELINRLLLEEDYKNLSRINLEQIKKLISYYQIMNEDEKKENNKIKINVFFDKDKMHDFFYSRNILYSDIINTEVILFPLLKKNDQYFIYTKNYFYENWNEEKSDNLIQYILTNENIENIQKINFHKDNIYKIEVSDFFKEYENDNIVFANIEINKKDIAEVFLSTRIEGKKINKNLSIKNKKNLSNKKFNREIIFEINNIIKDLIKSQNLIDVRTPSFLNVEIKLNKKSNLVEFSNRLNNIDLIDNFYVQQLNKDYVLVKIKYLGKINKIINKLKDQNINLKMIAGQWQLTII
tara:strand:- start:1231 stop:2277 length:1047 start_codon:yes stop_codon:yes gene_type:complete